MDKGLLLLKTFATVYWNNLPINLTLEERDLGLVTQKESSSLELHKILIFGVSLKKEDCIIIKVCKSVPTN